MQKTLPSCILLCLLALVAGACSADPVPVRPIDTSSPAMPAGWPVTPSLTTTRIAATSPFRPTLRPTLTTSTPAVTEPSGTWHIPAVFLPESVNYLFGNLHWPEPGLLTLHDLDDIPILIDAASGKVVSRARFTPTPHPPEAATTPAGDIWIVCNPDGLTMLKSATQQVVSQSALLVEDCTWSVQWTTDGSAAALVTEDGEVYLWLPDGSNPKKIGTSARWMIPMWSPSGDQILLIDWPKSGDFTPDIMTINIAYRDGRPMLDTETQIDAGNQWELPWAIGWLTNTIIYNHRGCPYDEPCITDYYDARTGRFIIRNTRTESGGQKAELSPNGRWLLLEASPDAVNWEKRWDVRGPASDFGLIVIDLHTLRRSLVIHAGESFPVSDSDSLKFLGWDPESGRFYLVHFPVGSPAYDLPVGLLALHPENGYIERLVPDVAFARISPDQQYAFLVTAMTMDEGLATGLQAGMYRLDGAQIGAQVGALHSLGKRIEYETLNMMDVYANIAPPLLPYCWADASNRIAFADPLGNIWVMDTAGNMWPVASGLPAEDWRWDTWFDWSPDGRWLLIKRGEYMWIAQVGDAP